MTLFVVLAVSSSGRAKGARPLGSSLLAVGDAAKINQCGICLVVEDTLLLSKVEQVIFETRLPSRLAR